MKKITFLLTCLVIAVFITSCVNGQRNTRLGYGHSKTSDGTKPSVYTRRYQAILGKAAKESGYGCNYQKLGESMIGRRLVDESQFNAAYQTTEPLRVTDHLYHTGLAKSLQNERRKKVQRLEQINSAGLSVSDADIDQLEYEIAALDQLLNPIPINDALLEHANREKLWVDTAIARVSQLENTDAVYQSLAQFDGQQLDDYGRMCAEWRPYYLVDKGSMPSTGEHNDIVRLQKTIEDKLYAILISGNSTIANNIKAMKNGEDASRFHLTYVIGSPASSHALERAGMYNMYREQYHAANDRDRNLEKARKALKEANRNKAMAEIDTGVGRWHRMDKYGNSVIAIYKFERKGDVYFQSELLCDPRDKRGAVLFSAIVDADNENTPSFWNRNTGYGLPITYRTPGYERSTTAVISREGNTRYVNVFYVQFISPKSIDKNRLEGRIDSQEAAIYSLAEFVGRMRTGMSLALGVESLPAEEIEGKQSFTVSAEYVVGNKKDIWTSPDLGPISGPYARIKQACFPSDEAEY